MHPVLPAAYIRDAARVRFMSKREQRREAIRRIGDTAGLRPIKPHMSDDVLDESPEYNSYLMTL